MKVADLIERVRLREIALPEFQREYVWDVEQACKLLESLYHSFPTGSLLFWETTTPPAMKRVQNTQEAAGPRQIILDGQQRLTTLYLLVKGEPPPYYELAELEHDPRGLSFDLVTGAFLLPHDGKAPASSCVAVAACLDRDSQPDLLSIAQKFTGLQQGELVTDIVQKCANHLSKLRSILDYDYPIQVVPVSASLSDAIDVFDRVNSSGTKLTPAELALTHITGKWPEARQIMKALLHELATHHFRFDLDFLVQGLAGVVNYRADFVELRPLTVDQLRQGWEQLAKMLTTLASSVLKSAFIISDAYLASPEVLIPLAAYLARNGGEFPSDQARRRATYWLYAANMWGRYCSELEQRLAHDLSIVRRSPEPWGELVDAIIEQRGRIDVRPGDLEGRGPEHPLFRMVQTVVVARGATDWETNVSLSKIPWPRTRPLFAVPEQANGPEEQLRRKQMEEIANQLLLISEQPGPLLYKLPALAQKQPQIVDQHCIPADASLWQTLHVDAFLNARRELIAAAINNYLQTFRAASVPARPLTLTDLRNAGESVSIEYKSTLRSATDGSDKKDELELASLKTIAAFLNTEGGFLLIGVRDDGSICGIENDFTTTKDGDADWFERHLRGLITTSLGMDCNRLVRVDFVKSDEGTVCVVRVRRSPQPVFCRNKKEPTAASFYIRTGNATNLLPTAELGQYIRNHWKF